MPPKTAASASGTEIVASPAADSDDEFGWVPGDAWVTGNKAVRYGMHQHSIDPRSVHNAALVLSKWPAGNFTAGECMAYNLFEDRIFIDHCPPWDNPKTFTPHEFFEDEAIRIRAWMEIKAGIKLGKNDVFDLVISQAKRRTINPPADYLRSLEWDTKRRLDMWLTYYLGAVSQPKEYLAAVGTKWLVAAVARLFEPGYKFDHVLILEGRQGIGKSRTLENLATFGGERYFIDQGLDIRNKDSLISLQGKVIFEMAELVSFKKAETEQIKNFITQSFDFYRPPYARNSRTRGRMFVIAGSTNPEEGAGYFTDVTGNRRYWPVACGDNIDAEAIIKDREQLWAEAVFLYHHGEQVWLSDDEMKLAEHEQKQRLVADALLDDVEKAIDAIRLNGGHVTTNAIMDFLKIDPERKSNLLLSRVRSVLVGLGYKEIRPRVGGAQIRTWSRPSPYDLD